MPPKLRGSRQTLRVWAKRAWMRYSHKYLPHALLLVVVGIFASLYLWMDGRLSFPASFNDVFLSIDSYQEAHPEALPPKNLHLEKPTFLEEERTSVRRPPSMWSLSVLSSYFFFHVVFVASVLKEDMSLWKLFWGLFVFMVPFLSSFGEGYTSSSRNSFILFLLFLWGTRNSYFMICRYLSRNDFRLIRDSGSSFLGPTRSALISSYFFIILPQASLLCLITIPILLSLSSELTLFSYTLCSLGAVVWAVGFFFEARGDWLLFTYQQKLGVDGRGNAEGRVMMGDLFTLCQNPHLFGTMLVWWGYFLMGLGSFTLDGSQHLLQLLSLLATALQTSMLILSATTTQEESLTSDLTTREYLERTPLFWPLALHGRGAARK